MLPEPDLVMAVCVPEHPEIDRTLIAIWYTSMTPSTAKSSDKQDARPYSCCSTRVAVSRVYRTMILPVPLPLEGAGIDALGAVDALTQAVGYRSRGQALTQARTLHSSPATHRRW
jgi:hypothetical protein